MHVFATNQYGCLGRPPYDHVASCARKKSDIRCPRVGFGRREINRGADAIDVLACCVSIEWDHAPIQC